MQVLLQCLHNLRLLVGLSKNLEMGAEIFKKVDTRRGGGSNVIIV